MSLFSCIQGIKSTSERLISTDNTLFNQTEEVLKEFQNVKKDNNGRSINWLKVETLGQRQHLVIKEITLWDRILHFLGIGGFSKQAITEFFIENEPRIKNIIDQNKNESTKSLIFLVHKTLNVTPNKSAPEPQSQTLPNESPKPAISSDHKESNVIIPQNSDSPHQSQSPQSAGSAPKSLTGESDKETLCLLVAFESAKTSLNNESLNNLIGEFNELLECTKNDLVLINQESENTPGDIQLFTRLEALREVKKFFKISENSHTSNKKIAQALKDAINNWKSLVKTHQALSAIRDFSEYLRSEDEKLSIIHKFGSCEISPRDERLRNIGFRFKEFVQDTAFNDASDSIPSNSYKTIIKSKQTSEWSSKLSNLRKKIFLSQREIERSVPKELRNREIQWVSGNSSAALPVIMNKIIKAVNAPALIPTGNLFAHDIVPLSGELMMGISKLGINRNNLSGVAFEHFHGSVQYARASGFRANLTREIDLLKGIQTCWSHYLPRMKVAATRCRLLNCDPKVLQELYDLLKQAHKDNPHKLEPEPKGFKDAVFRLGKEFTIASPKPISQTLKEGDIVLYGESNPKQVAIVERIRSNGNPILYISKFETKEIVNHQNAIFECPSDQIKKIELTENELIEGRKILTNLRIYLGFKEIYESLAEILDPQNQSIPALNFDHEEMDFIESTIPLVWASTTAQEKQFVRVRSDIKGERAIEGALLLGKDLQYVFTDSKYVEKVQTYLDKKLEPYQQKVYVLSLEAAAFFFSQRVEYNGYCHYMKSWHEQWVLSQNRKRN